jgi:eukaryotic-like serine/threonine-protein kinase
VLDQALSADSLIGLELSHYRITEKIGSGGMGVVYRARDEHLDREVAVKVLGPGTITDEAARKHLRKEALALSKLNHPNIATIHDFDTQQGVDFLVMEYIPGITLRDKLTGGGLPEKETLRLGLQLAEGLSAAHEHGVVHRDLKPGNLKLSADGGLKILDFGLAKLRRPAAESVTGDSLSETRAMSGTLPYMAPEQLSGEEIDDRTDIHAAGLVLYEMATGQRPFAEVPSGQLIGALLCKPPIPPTMLNPKVSAELERIIGKCVEKDPENRYQTAKELAVDLRRLLTPGVVKGAEGPVAGRKLWKVLVAAAVILAAATGGMFYRHFRAPVLSQHAVVLLADVENLTGEKLFDETVTEAIRQSLIQSRYVRLVPRSEVLEAANRMGGKNITHLDAALGLEICRRENYSALLTGRIESVGKKYLLTIQVLDPKEGVPVLTLAETLSSPAELFNATDDLTRSLRERLGESLALINQSSQPLAKVTTPSLEALQRYSRAMDFYAAANFEDFIPLAKSATEIDPNFAMAHLYLARAMDWVGDQESARQQMTQARQNLARVTERERYLILANDCEFQGRYEKAAEQYRLLTEIYPDDLEGYRGLAEAAFWAGRSEEGIAAMEHAVALNLRSADDLQRLILGYVRLNRFSDALERYQEARIQGARRPMLHWGAGLAHLGQGDSQAARQEFELLRKEGGPYEASLASLNLARVLLYEGRLSEATESLRAGLVVGEKLRSETWIPVQRYLLAQVLWERGQVSEARAEVRRLADPANSHPDEEGLRRGGLMALQLGDLRTARLLLKQLAELNAQRDSGYTRSCYYNLKGAMDLASGDDGSAIESQRRAALFFPSYQAQARLGSAYAARKEWRSAAEALQRYLEFKGEIFEFDSPLEWVLMHLTLARVLVKAGDANQAIHYYDEFLQIWAHADPDLPALREARAERAQLSKQLAANTANTPITRAIPQAR